MTDNYAYIKIMEDQNHGLASSRERRRRKNGVSK